MVSTVIVSFRKPNFRTSLAKLIVATVIVSNLIIPVEAQSARPVLALAPVSGAKKAGTKTFEKAFIGEFSRQKVDVLTPEQLKKTAKKARGNSKSNYIADLAGADFKISVRIRKKKRGYQLSAQLVELVRNQTVESAKWNYKLSKRDRKENLEDNAKKASKAIVKKFMNKMDDSFSAMIGDNKENASELP